jgi:hypothetical protein
VTATLLTFLLFAYEIFQGRRLAKAKHDSAKRWSQITTQSLTELTELLSSEPTTVLDDPWTSLGDKQGLAKQLGPGPSPAHPRAILHKDKAFQTSMR